MQHFRPQDVMVPVKLSETAEPEELEERCHFGALSEYLLRGMIHFRRFVVF